MGICFQIVINDSIHTHADESGDNLATLATGSVRKWRRALTCIDLDIEPYRKKPKMDKSAFIPVTDERRLHIPACHADVLKLD